MAIIQPTEPVAHPSQSKGMSSDDHAGGSLSFFIKWSGVWMLLLAILLCFMPSDRDSSSTPVIDAQCMDVGADCEQWARKGECQKNAAYMKEYCCRTCASPEQQPERSGGQPSVGTPAGEPPPPVASSPPPVASSPAPVVCIDSSSSCGPWAAKGEGTRNPTFIHSTCALACGACH